MVRKINAFNREKVKVRLDGKTYRMHFKKAQKAIEKAAKAYFHDDGLIELTSKEWEKRSALDELQIAQEEDEKNEKDTNNS